MSTYLNCYEMVSQIRYALNEYSTAYVQGTSTTGSYQNAEIVRAINAAQMFIQGGVRRNVPELFFTSTTLTGTASVYTLPSDLWKIKRLETAEGYVIRPGSIDGKHVDAETGTEYRYYRYGNSLRIDEDNVTEPLTLWYETRCRDLDFGASSAGGARSLTLASPARPIAAYYNGMTIENITDSWVDTISDYSAARVCTLAAQTGASSKYYGIVPELPDAFHQLILDRAILRMKMHPNAPEKPTPYEVKTFQEDFAAALSSYGS